ncbi:2-amino-4-hydroxy-6-hydroxymethyldihydropteridine diphosphokinase [Brumicola nitratireducens]|uniref:2-amino-4-hydroxy-6-hydroxymethyldihydropteridine diphosphokinase n=1 Tax=Glaciecola nitratireducens (strain JCM 12485 / KCTC 12276 / FR1064) TaxID=1085623 RepID=G4QMG3_GLANF|nr:2-amino-4-hydroxy-6-hydroxymethyldihydropteridine diphosphokinase [Glaciecola nitratireducens]AEP30915.1 2-amino-4-hydroxy-6- hydroxymethyldihydropteridine pyrophosphokinase [Glaciecola nitratireducens FR1064]
MQLVPHFILISVGSNIDKAANTDAGLNGLNKAFDGIQLSPVYESESVGFKGDTFFNLVVSASTNKSIARVCEILKQIEDENGRVRGSEKFAPRTLDLDLLTYDDTVIDNPIVLPREEILYNAFVLRPLADLVPQHMHPLVKKTYQSLWQQYDKQKQNLWVADYTWSKTKT